MRTIGYLGFVVDALVVAEAGVTGDQLWQGSVTVCHAQQHAKPHTEPSAAASGRAETTVAIRAWGGKMRCLECGAEIAGQAQVCARCGSWAPVEYRLYVAEDRAADAAYDAAGQQRPESAPDPDGDRAELAEWVQTRRFSTTRLRPGYDPEEVDAFLDAICDSFLGVREPSLTPDEIRVKQFSVTRLRPGYDEEEVDAFLDEAVSRLAAQLSAERGVPAAGPESGAADPARAVQINDAARPAARDETRDTTFLIAGGGHDMAQGRDDNALAEDDTGWGNPPDPEVAQHGEQPHDGLAGQPRTAELDRDADSLPIQNRPETSLVYLAAASCLAGSLVSVWVAVTEAELAAHNRVGNLAIVGMVIGALAGLAAVAVNEEKPRGWASRINIVAAWLALISFSTLLLLFMGQHGWYGDGG